MGIVAEASRKKSAVVCGPKGSVEIGSPVPGVARVK